MEKKQKRSAGQIVLNIVGIILCVIFIPLIIFNITLIIKSYSNDDKMPSVFGVAPVICLSGSMEPEFSVGDMIFIKDVNPESLIEGDVICYIPYGTETAVTHRIIETKMNGGQKVFITKGDANNITDSTPVSAVELQGKYTGVHIAKMGDVAMFMQKPVGMIIFIVAPLVLFILWDVLRRALGSKKSKGDAVKMQEELEMLRAQVGGPTGESVPEQTSETQTEHKEQ